MKKRAKNPLFLLAAFSVVWQVLQIFNIQIEHELFKTAVDTFCYLFIGVGIYSSFEDRAKEGE